MKKLLALLLVFAMVAPLFAQASVTGETKAAYVTTVGGDTTGEKNMLRYDVKIKGKADDFNSYEIVIRTEGSSNSKLDKAYITSDLGKFLGLDGKSLKLMVGYNDFKNKNVGKITPMQTESILDDGGKKNGTYPVIGLDVGISPAFNLKVGAATAYTTDGSLIGRKGIISANGKVSTLTYEASFFMHGAADMVGDFAGLGLNYGMDLGEAAALTAAANVKYMVDDTEMDAGAVTYSAAVKADTKSDAPISFALALNGSSATDNALNGLSVGLVFAHPVVTLETACELALYPDAPSSLNQVTIGVKKVVGIAEFRAGFIMSPEDAGSNSMIKDKQDIYSYAKYTEGENNIYMQVKCAF